MLLLVVEIKLTINSRGNESIYFQTNVPLGIFAYHILAHFPSKKKNEKHGTMEEETKQTKRKKNSDFFLIESNEKLK